MSGNDPLRSMPMTSLASFPKQQNGAALLLMMLVVIVGAPCRAQWSTKWKYSA